MLCKRRKLNELRARRLACQLLELAPMLAQVHNFEGVNVGCLGLQHVCAGTALACSPGLPQALKSKLNMMSIPTPFQVGSKTTLKWSTASITLQVTAGEAKHDLTHTYSRPPETT